MYTPQDDYGEETLDTSNDNIFEVTSKLDKLADAGHVMLLKQAMLSVKELKQLQTVDEKQCDWTEVLL